VPVVRALVFLALALSAATAHADEPLRLHVELDPLPFARGGYGGQAGAHVTPHVRVAIASFALDVPDFVAQSGGNDDFHIRVRPSLGAYGLYYLSPGRNGWALGGAVRLLRLSYTQGDFGGATELLQVSPELIVAYRWHPWRSSGFYLQPWFGLSVVLYEDAEPPAGYDPPPLSPFFTVNLGWALVDRDDD
jgi:hypothetical protein